MFRILRGVSTMAAVVVFGWVDMAADQAAVPQAGSVRSRVQAPATSRTEPVVAQIDRALVDKYCLTCHNEKLKTAGLMLDRVDFTQVPAEAAVLEKVVHKLRTGQMPPVGRPRPDKAILDAFATALESALD